MTPTLVGRPASRSFRRRSRIPSAASRIMSGCFASGATRYRSTATSKPSSCSAAAIGRPSFATDTKEYPPPGTTITAPRGVPSTVRNVRLGPASASPPGHSASRGGSSG